ncbi:MAG: DUF6132 family protein [Planctomycetota bacterium]
MILLKTAMGIGLCAALGAAVGYSQLLCPNGGCNITGSWYGGAMFGGVMGLALTGAIGGKALTGSNLDNEQAPTDEPDDEPTEPTAR